MAARTGQQLVTSIQEHLGNRVSGYIGSTAVADAVLDSLNKAKKRICKNYSPMSLERSLDLSLTTAAYSYALPTSDGTNTIKIKNIVACVLQATNETQGKVLKRLTLKERLPFAPITSTDFPGRPQYYTQRQNNLEFHPYPDDTYTVHIYCNIWSVDITATTLGQVTDLGEEWDDVIEAFATADCFAKLQQTQDSQRWMQIFIDLMRRTIGMLEENPDWEPDSDQSFGRSPDPFQDPFVRMII